MKNRTYNFFVRKTKMPSTATSPFTSVHLAADHRGVALKAALCAHVQEHHATTLTTIHDHGTNTNTPSVDYPDYAHTVARCVAREPHACGILLCHTANGMAMTANTHTGVRAGLCWTPDVAALVRQHNDANVLCIPVGFVTDDEACAIVDAFLTGVFEGGRHARRVARIDVSTSDSE